VADEELAAEDLPLPPIDALFTYPDRDLGEPGFDWWRHERYALENPDVGDPGRGGPPTGDRAGD
jgi:hypothetical protein